MLVLAVCILPRPISPRVAERWLRPANLVFPLSSERVIEGQDPCWFPGVFLVALERVELGRTPTSDFVVAWCSPKPVSLIFAALRSALGILRCRPWSSYSYHSDALMRKETAFRPYFWNDPWWLVVVFRENHKTRLYKLLYDGLLS